MGRALRFRAKLRLPNGTWEQLKVQSPVGSLVQIVANPDKNRRTQFEELTARLYQRALADWAASLPTGPAAPPEFQFMRNERAVACGWQGVLEVRSPSEGAPHVDWNDELVTRLGFDKHDIYQRVVALKTRVNSAAARQGWTRDDV